MLINKHLFFNGRHSGNKTMWGFSLGNKFDINAEHTMGNELEFSQWEENSYNFVYLFR